MGKDPPGYCYVMAFVVSGLVSPLTCFSLGVVQEPPLTAMPFTSPCACQHLQTPLKRTQTHSKIEHAQAIDVAQRPSNAGLSTQRSPAGDQVPTILEHYAFQDYFWLLCISLFSKATNQYCCRPLEPVCVSTLPKHSSMLLS